MSWFDQAVETGGRLTGKVKDAVAALPTSWDEVKGHAVSGWNSIKNNVKEFHQEKVQASQELKQQRQEAEQRIAALKDPNQYRNMSQEQRDAHVHEIAGEMPGHGAILHANGYVNALTAPVRWVGSLFTLGRGATASIAPHITPSSNTMFLFLAILYHTAIIFTLDPSLVNRIWLNIGMFFLVNFLVFDPSERNGDTYRNLLLFVIFFEIVIPAIATFPAVYSLTFVRLYLANSFLIWTWVYYAVFVRGKNITTGPTKWVRVLIIILWIGVALSFVGVSMRSGSFSDVELNSAGKEQLYAAELIWDKGLEGWDLLFTGVTGVFSNMQSIAEMRLKQATGEYYYGVVETNEKEKLGVYLENLKASQAEYEINEPVTVFATLIAKTLGDTITAKIGCYEGNEKNAIVGSVYPNTEFTVSTLQQEELDCTFEKLPQGTDKITYTANFNFETIGYLKRYFADRDAITAATQQNIDLLSEYQIQDTNPVAHYTNGPVGIGIGPEQALIGISESYTVKPRLALTIDGHAQGWGGKITALNEVVLLLPEQMSLDTSQCTDADWSTYTVDACVSSESSYESKIAQDCEYDNGCIEEKCNEQLSGYNAYALNVAKQTYKDIKEYITISCRMNIDDVQGLLGATPISTKYFYVKTRYTYQISEDTSVKVTEQASEAPGSISGETSTTKSEVSSIPTFTAFDEDEEMQYIFYHYGDFLFAAAEQFSVPVCTIGAIIAETSAANPNYYQDGRKGLMGLPDTLSQQMSGPAGFTGSYNVYDPQTNIKLGAAYLGRIIQDVGSSTDTVPVAYYNALYNRNPDETSSSNEEADLYAAHVKNFKEKYCTNAGLENSHIATSQKNADAPFIEGSIPYESTSPTTLQLSYNENPLSLNVSTMDKFVTSSVITEDFEIISLNFKDSSLGIINNYLKVNQWIKFSKYPLFQVFFDSTAKEIRYKYPQDFIIDTSTLLEDEPSAIIAGTLYIEYEGSNIIVSTIVQPSTPDDRKEICSMDWYQDIAYADCKAEGVPGLLIRNVLTHQDTPGQGYAKLQIEWNNTKQLEEALS